MSKRAIVSLESRTVLVIAAWFVKNAAMIGAVVGLLPIVGGHFLSAACIFIGCVLLAFAAGAIEILVSIEHLVAQSIPEELESQRIL